MAIDDRRFGLYGKYQVLRMDGGDASGLKHDGCKHFVLDLQHDPYAKPALRAYADACRAEYPALAADLEAYAGPAAITAALGDAALVVTPERLRAALTQAWLDGHSYTGTGYLDDSRFDAIIAELATPGQS